MDTGDGRLLAKLLEPLATNNGHTESSLSNVRFMRSDMSIPRHPVVYEPSIVIIAQGHKTGYLGNQVYRYDPYNYLVLSVPLPFECETCGTPGEPLLGVVIGVDVTIVSELLLEMDDNYSLSGSVTRGIYSMQLTYELVNATARLLKVLRHPLDGRILGPQIVREIIYRVLCGEQGGALRSLAARHSRFGQIAKALKRMHTEYNSELDINMLASEANMSVSSFHSNFKAVTDVSPLQYLKSIRLHKARMLMIQDGIGVSNAATRVGYESASQFSREFKRYFGFSPSDAVAKMV
ncbi:MAG: AraC family transcriptional regulator [Armatimonadota bacterium]|nr:AraC family transcriptional regulator [bacterium]